MNKKNIIVGIFLAGMLFTQTALASCESDCQESHAGEDLRICLDACETNGTGGSGWNVDSVKSFNLPDASIFNIVTRILRWMLGILGMVGVIGFAIAGMMYLTAAGDEKRIGTAKTAMTYSIIGVIVGIAGVVIIQAVDAMLRGGARF